MRSRQILSFKRFLPVRGDIFRYQDSSPCAEAHVPDRHCRSFHPWIQLWIHGGSGLSLVIGTLILGRVLRSLTKGTPPNDRSAEGARKRTGKSDRTALRAHLSSHVWRRHHRHRRVSLRRVRPGSRLRNCTPSFSGTPISLRFPENNISFEAAIIRHYCSLECSKRACNKHDF